MVAVEDLGAVFPGPPAGPPAPGEVDPVCVLARQLIDGDAERAGDGLGDGHCRLGLAGLVAPDLALVHADLGGQWIATCSTRLAAAGCRRPRTSPSAPSLLPFPYPDSFQPTRGGDGRSPGLASGGCRFRPAPARSDLDAWSDVLAAPFAT